MIGGLKHLISGALCSNTSRYLRAWVKIWSRSWSEILENNCVIRGLFVDLFPKVEFLVCYIVTSYGTHRAKIVALKAWLFSSFNPSEEICLERNEMAIHHHEKDFP